MSQPNSNLKPKEQTETPRLSTSQSSIPSNQTINQKPINFNSMIYSYFGDSEIYLNRKYSENQKFDYKQSNNFIRKDSLSHNINKNQNITDTQSNDSDEDDYSQLMQGGNYTQIIQDNYANNNPNLMNYIYNHPNFPLIPINQINNRPRFNSMGGFLNVALFPPIVGNNYMDDFGENFKRKGWVCSSCMNFNFDTRTKCNRCKKPKSPKNKDNFSIKQFPERLGDWICFQCHNLNFAFRTVCNKCHCSKKESDKLLTQSSNFPIK